MSGDIIKKDIKSLIEDETPNLTNLLSSEDVSAFKEMTEELRDTWHKKQCFEPRPKQDFLYYKIIDIQPKLQNTGNVSENNHHI